MDTVFIDRDEELNRLASVKPPAIVLVKGPRGIGKTALLKEFCRRLSQEGKKHVYVDCLKVLRPRQLVEEAIDWVASWELRLPERPEVLRRAYRARRPDEALETFFRFCYDIGVDVAILDEFTTLIRRFSRRRPYASADEVASHMRSLMESFPCLWILCSTSMEDVYQLCESARKPFARAIDIAFEVLPLAFRDIEKLVRSVNPRLDDESVKIVSLASCGNPFYAKAFAYSCLPGEEPKASVKRTLEAGAIGQYFEALFASLSPPEADVASHIAMGYRRYRDLELEDILDLPQALRGLMRKGLVGKTVLSRKHIIYWLKDNAFASWLAMRGIPGKGSWPFEKVWEQYLGFQGHFARFLRSLSKPKEIQGVRLGPYKDVRVKREAVHAAGESRDLFYCSYEPKKPQRDPNLERLSERKFVVFYHQPTKDLRTALEKEGYRVLVLEARRFS